MSEGPYREADSGGSGEVTHCLFCGEERDDATGACLRCKAVTGALRIDDSPDAGFPCPRCSAPLSRQSFGRATIKACGACRGFFCPALQFSILVNDYASGVALPLDTLAVLPPGKEVSRLAFVNCIACGSAMDRVNFASRSDAIVDVCASHGIWLDAGELIPILHFVKTRAELGEVPLSEQEIADHAALVAERVASGHREFRAGMAAHVITLLGSSHGLFLNVVLNRDTSADDDYEL